MRCLFILLFVLFCLYAYFSGIFFLYVVAALLLSATVIWLFDVEFQHFLAVEPRLYVVADADVATIERRWWYDDIPGLDYHILAQQLYRLVDRGHRIGK